MTDTDVLLLEILAAQIMAVVLGTVSIAAADWSYRTGHIRQALHPVWVACSVAAICLPMLAWISSVFLGSGVFSQGLVGMLMGVIFLWVHRNLPKFAARSTQGGHFMLGGRSTLRFVAQARKNGNSPASRIPPSDVTLGPQADVSRLASATADPRTRSSKPRFAIRALKKFDTKAAPGD
jgi:hypothetical protein